MASPIVLPAIISDGMVLQAGKPATIWGECAPLERIRIEIAGLRVETRGDRSGRFAARVRVVRAGGPYQLHISGHAERIIDNILVGDVWLGSGQSNMEWWVAHVTDAAREIAAAGHPRIRLFQVAAGACKLPRDHVHGRWVECDPQTVRTFSAVAYFFGREIHLRTGRPIGLIGSSWGGTAIEPWISLRGLRRYDGFRTLWRSQRKNLTAPEKPEERSFYADTGDLGIGRGWADRRCSRVGWKPIVAPGCWNTKGVHCVGAVWLRRNFSVSRSWLGQDLRLSLGPLVDFDATYVNGEHVGGLPPGTAGAWNVPRRYVVPAGLVTAGTNSIAVRVFAHGTNGGFAGSADQLNLSIINDRRGRTIPLAGRWTYRIERRLEPIAAASRGTVPSTIFNAMIAPLGRFALRGVLWYQGESNVSDPRAYRTLLPLLIRDWRRHWGDETLPFHVAQLSDYPRPDGDDKLPRLREAQDLATKQIPHTGLAVTLDGGERDIHARNKQMVGRRLALLALADTYAAKRGKRVIASGPVMTGMRTKGPLVRLRFDQPLVCTDQQAPAFAIAGSDRVFHPARTTITRDTVVIWSPRVPEPQAVRYAWGDTPPCTLFNRGGLPAPPFRTDDWPPAG